MTEVAAADLPAVDVDTTDAMEWAKAFCARVRTGLDATDEGWLVGWFANAMAAQERADRAKAGSGDPASRAADAIADLADAMMSFRELIEREEARMRKREDDEDAREGRRAAAEWQEGLIAVESFLRGVRFDVQVTRKDIEVTSDIEKIIVNVAPDGVKAIVAELDKRLRSSASWSLQRGLQTLGGRPPKDLRAEAEAFADRNGADGPARVAAIEAYLAGAGVER